jgi:hypothetical protein
MLTENQGILALKAPGPMHMSLHPSPIKPFRNHSENLTQSAKRERNATVLLPKDFSLENPTKTKTMTQSQSTLWTLPKKSKKLRVLSQKEYQPVKLRNKINFQRPTCLSHLLILFQKDFKIKQRVPIQWKR